MSPLQVFVPACRDARTDGHDGWAVLTGLQNPPEAVAFCWTREHAVAIVDALAATGKLVTWIGPAILRGDEP